MLRCFLTSLLLFAGVLCSAQNLRVKVSIDTTGIYAVDHAALIDMGFEHPEKVGVFGSGGVLPSDHCFNSGFTPLAPAPFMHTSDRLLFYGEGTVRATVSSSSSASIEKCYTSDRACYFLAESGNGGLTDGAEPTSDFIPDTTHLAVQYFERDIFSPSNGGAIQLSHRLIPGISDTYFLDCEGLDRNYATPVYVYCSYGLKNSIKTAPVVTFSSGTEVLSMQNAGVGGSSSDIVTYRPGYFSATIRPAAGNDSATIAIAPPSDFKGDLCAVDYLYTISRRTNTLRGNRCSIMHMCGPGGTLLFENVPASLTVWNVTPGSTPQNCPVDFNASTAVAAYSSLANKATLVAFDSEGTFPSPAIEGVAADLDISGSPEMLVIAAPALLEQAEELADIHRRYEGMEVLVVKSTDVYNHYADGLRTPMAFRRLARQLYDGGRGALKHIVLYGAADVYNKRINDEGCYLVCFEAENVDHSRQISTNYCSDQYFGMLADDYTPGNIERAPMQVNVGRIPATYPAMAADYNSKVRRYYELGPDPLYSARTFLLSGPGDDYIHFQQSEEFAGLLGVNPLLSVARGDSYLYYPVGDGWPDLDRTLARSLTLGTGLLAFAGHTNPTALSNIDFNFIDEHRYRRPPLGFFASCESFAIDHPDFSIGRLMLMRPEGGVLGVMAAGRTVVLNHNRRFGVAVAQEYTVLQPGDTWGDLFRRARNRLLDEKVANAVMVNTLCYNYGGDPALPFHIPSFGIKGEVGELHAGVPAVLTGSIKDSSGAVAEYFNGTVEVNVHCPADTLVNLVDSEPLTAVDNHPLMLRAAGRVEAGRFSVPVTAPVMARDGVVRISLGAVGSDGLCALGVMETTYSMDGAEVVGDAPDVDDIEIDTDRAFTAGVCTLRAKVHAGVGGIRITPGLGTGVNVLLDGHTTLPDISLTLADGGVAEIEVPFATPVLGRHTIELSLASNTGAKIRRAVDFIIARPKPSAVLRHDLGPECVARESIEFAVEGTGGDGPRLLVTDGAGNTVFTTVAEAWPYVWNLCRTDGSRVPDGLYRATVMFPATAHATPYVEFVVLGAQ